MSACIGNRNLCLEPVISGGYCAKHSPDRWRSHLIESGDGPTRTHMTYELHYFGQPTGIRLHQESNGKRGGYRFTVNLLVNASGEECDLLTAKGADKRAWLESQLDKPEHALWASPERPA